MDAAILNKIVVCAYCRVSTDKESQLNSLSNQTYYFEEKIKQNNKYEMYKIYPDEGLSATSWKRRIKFKEMLYDAGLDIEFHRKEIKAYVSNREPKFSRILVKDVSRFSRNASEGLELVTKLREKNVHIDFVSLGLSTEQMTNDMIIGFFLLAAENESKDRSVKTSWGKKISAEKGVIQTADKFYGYKYLIDTNELEIVEHEAEVVRLMFNLYVNEGYGFRRIMNVLEENKMFTRSGKPFVQTSVSRILRNPAYKGLLVRNKMDSPKVFTSKTYATVKPEEEWVVTEGRIPQIVDEDIFDKAIELRKSKLHYKQRIGVYYGISDYAGMIYCSECGSNYTKNTEARNGKGYYNCKLKKRKGTKYCSNVSVYLNQIEEVINHLSEFGLYDALIKDRTQHIHLIEVRVSELRNKMNQQNIEEVENLKIQLDELNEENKRLAMLYVKGKLSEEILDRMQSELDEKIQNLNDEITEKSLDNNQIAQKIEKLNGYIEELNAMEIKQNYTAEEVKNQIQHFWVSRDKLDPKKPHLEIKFKLFEEINEITSFIKE